jgi:hypothetical protein
LKFDSRILLILLVYWIYVDPIFEFISINYFELIYSIVFYASLKIINSPLISCNSSSTNSYSSNPGSV